MSPRPCVRKHVVIKAGNLLSILRVYEEKVSDWLMASGCLGWLLNPWCCLKQMYSRRNSRQEQTNKNKRKRQCSVFKCNSLSYWKSTVNRKITTCNTLALGYFSSRKVKTEPPHWCVFFFKNCYDSLMYFFHCSFLALGILVFKPHWAMKKRNEFSGHLLAKMSVLLKDKQYY